MKDLLFELLKTTYYSNMVHCENYERVDFSLRSKNNSQLGQSLITLLFFMAIGITVVVAAALVVSADILTASNAEKGLSAYYAAEGGVEDGILYVLRNHPTTSQTLTLSTATVIITYNGGVNTITAVGTNGTTRKTVSAQATFLNGTFTISNWREQ